MRFLGIVALKCKCAKKLFLFFFFSNGTEPDLEIFHLSESKTQGLKEKSLVYEEEKMETLINWLFS